MASGSKLSYREAAEPFERRWNANKRRLETFATTDADDEDVSSHWKKARSLVDVDLKTATARTMGEVALKASSHSVDLINEKKDMKTMMYDLSHKLEILMQRDEQKTRQIEALTGNDQQKTRQIEGLLRNDGQKTKEIETLKRSNERSERFSRDRDISLNATIGALRKEVEKNSEYRRECLRMEVRDRYNKFISLWLERDVIANLSVEECNNSEDFWRLLNAEARRFKNEFQRPPNYAMRVDTTRLEKYSFHGALGEYARANGIDDIWSLLLFKRKRNKEIHGGVTMESLICEKRRLASEDSDVAASYGDLTDVFQQLVDRLTSVWDDVWEDEDEEGELLQQQTLRIGAQPVRGNIMENLSQNVPFE